MNFWKLFWSVAAIVATLVLGAPFTARADNDDNVFHYACHSKNGLRYAVTVHPDRGIVQMLEMAAPHNTTTFQIKKDEIAACHAEPPPFPPGNWRVGLWKPRRLLLYSLSS